MADQLATPQDLASQAQQVWADLSAAEQTRLTMLVECATAVVQAVCGGQRIVAATSTAVLPAVRGTVLDLPQWPVRAVSSVSIDGVADTQWRLEGGGLVRCTWRAAPGKTGQVTVAYDHGYPVGSQGLQLGRHAVLSLSAPLVDNPTGRLREQFDDWATAYEAMATRMEASRFLQDRLVSQYGKPASSVRMGG